MPARILIVDDDLGYLAVTKEVLEQVGYEVLVASTFHEGRRALKEQAPDLLIADVRLGAFNGLQLIATGTPRIPTIVVSGFDDAVLQEDAKAFGAEYLVKPVTVAVLHALIDQKLATASRPIVATPTATNPAASLETS